MLRNKTILIISPEAWSHIFVSKHHYAQELAKQNRVVFLNPPITDKIISAKHGDVTVVDYYSFVKGYRFLPKIIRKALLKRFVLQLEKKLRLTFDMIWSFDNSVFFDLDAFPEKLTISHIVDINQDFNTAQASGSADICLGVVDAITQRHLQFNKNAFTLAHGVNIDTPTDKIKIELPGKNQIKAVYVGNMSMPFIDWNILAELAKINTDKVDFILIGSDHELANKNHPEVYGLENVYQIQKIAATEVLNYLTAADILLLLYSPEFYMNYASPHKFLEYLLSGKVIASMYIAEYAQLAKEELILMVNEDFSMQEIFAKAVEENERLNDQNLILKRKNFAKARSYEKRVEQVHKLLIENNLI